MCPCGAHRDREPADWCEGFSAAQCSASLVAVEDIFLCSVENGRICSPAVIERVSRCQRGPRERVPLRGAPRHRTHGVLR